MFFSTRPAADHDATFPELEVPAFIGKCGRLDLSPDVAKARI